MNYIPGHLDSLATLIEHGGDVSVKNTDDKTSLDLATGACLEHLTTEGNLQITRNATSKK